MKSKALKAWNKITQAQANVWLTAVIVVLFVMAIGALNYVDIQGERSQAKSLAQTTYTASQQQFSGNFNGAAAVGPASVSLTSSSGILGEPDNQPITEGQPVYLTATMSNVRNCFIDSQNGVDNNQPLHRAIATTDSGKRLVYPSDHGSSTYPLRYDLNCERVSDSSPINTFRIVAFKRASTITAQEAIISTNGTITPRGREMGETLQIDSGNGVILRRACPAPAKSGYIKNSNGTILTSDADKNSPGETLYVLHDQDGPANGIHSNKTYTASCFSLPNNRGTQTTSSINVVVR